MNVRMGRVSEFPMSFVFLFCIIFVSLSNGRPQVKVEVNNQQQPQPEIKTTEKVAQPHPEIQTTESIRQDTTIIGPEKQPAQEDHSTPPKVEAVTESEPVPLNIKDVRSRALAEQLKHLPIQAGDTEEIMHGGHHVHGEGHGDKNQPVGTGGLDMVEIMDGEKKEEKKVAPSTMDTEEMMHAGDGGHDHDNPHLQSNEEKHEPSAHNPEDLLHMRDMDDHHERLKGHAPSVENPEESSHHRNLPQIELTKHKEDGHNVGVSIEKVVHGDDAEHHHDGDVTEEYVDEHGNTQKRKVGKEITMEDIERLGLNKKDLEGIDLSKLLRKDKAEYDSWKKNTQAAGDEKDKSFWDKVDDFRENYFNMLSKQIRHMSRFDDDDDPEWERDFDDSPHPGESRVEHESELWGNTDTKPNRKRRARHFTVIHDQQPHDMLDEL